MFIVKIYNIDLSCSQPKLEKGYIIVYYQGYCSNTGLFIRKFYEIGNKYGNINFVNKPI